MSAHATCKRGDKLLAQDVFAWLLSACADSLTHSPTVHTRALPCMQARAREREYEREAEVERRREDERRREMEERYKERLREWERGER